MKKFLRNYQDILLGFFGFILLATVAGYFVWGLGILSREFPAALGFAQGTPTIELFDFEGYKKLNLSTQ